MHLHAAIYKGASLQVTGMISSGWKTNQGAVTGYARDKYNKCCACACYVCYRVDGVLIGAATCVSSSIPVCAAALALLC
jgi:hypothetical protein